LLLKLGDVGTGEGDFRVRGLGGGRHHAMVSAGVRHGVRN
jgi:hypothetical protein